jgi:hypothetical protein
MCQGFAACDEQRSNKVNWPGLTMRKRACDAARSAAPNAEENSQGKTGIESSGSRMADRLRARDGRQVARDNVQTGSQIIRLLQRFLRRYGIACATALAARQNGHLFRTRRTVLRRRKAAIRSSSRLFRLATFRNALAPPWRHCQEKCVSENGELEYEGSHTPVSYPSVSAEHQHAS